MFDLNIYRQSRRLYGILRYGVVLLVWLTLFLIKPRLAILAFKNRRLGSPIPRSSRAWTIGHGLSPIL